MMRKRLVKLFDENKEKLQSVGIEQIWYDTDAWEMTALIIKTDHDIEEDVEAKLGYETVNVKYIRLPKDAEDVVNEIMAPMSQELFDNRLSLSLYSSYYLRFPYEVLVYPVPSIIEQNEQKIKKLENQLAKLKEKQAKLKAGDLDQIE